VTAAGGSGGAVFVDIGNTRIHILSLNFFKNTAHLEGAVSLSQSNYPISFHDCNFTYNHASGKGGAVYLGDGNGYGFFQVFTISAIRFLGAMISRSIALSGGGVYVSNSNAVTFNNTVMSGNIASYSGGALYIESRNIVHIYHTELSQHTAQSGGATKISGINNVTFNNLSYIRMNNASLDGGAVSVSQGSEGSAVAFEGETFFILNRAGENGGAIHSSGSTRRLGSKSVTFERNLARQGSAIRLEAMISPSVVISPSYSFITFLRNTCSQRGRERGGTVSWVKDP
jgi:predicted outer membrane repeat protein